jgi:eukaryotic-like serine/threonine-protein kinase
VRSYASRLKLTTGTQLGPYTILAPLGAGGMGEVYRARDTRLGREVALKILTDKLIGNRDALERFEREARTVAALSHPNIVALYDYGQYDGTVCAVTELLDGESLEIAAWRASACHGGRQSSSQRR